MISAFARLFVDPLRGARLDVSLVLLTALLSLFVFSLFLGTGRLHIGGNAGSLNDQVGYISVARNLVRHGVLESQIIYASIEGQGATRNYPYMPGHYLLLGASIALFGERVVAFLLPSLLAFLLTALCVYGIGAKLYDRSVGLLAALFFCLFPFNAAYAFTAMAESTFTLAFCAALLLFLSFPGRSRFVIGPFLLVVPFLFRETGALLVIPMLILSVRGQRHRLLKGLAFGALAATALGVTYRLPFSAGRGSLIMANVFGGSEEAIYSNAFWNPGPLTAADWLDAIWRKLALNSTALWWALDTGLGTSPQYVAFVLILVTAGVCLFDGIRRLARDPFPLAVALVMAAALAMVFFLLHDILSFRGLRHMMFALPLAAVVLGRMLSEARLHGAVKMSLGAAFGVAALFQFREIAAGMMAWDSVDDADLEFVESLHHDDTRLLLAPWYLAFPYVLHHPDVRYSFLPANEETFRLLNERYGAGTVVLDIPAAANISEATLRQAGLFPEGNRRHRRVRLLIYRAKDPDGFSSHPRGLAAASSTSPAALVLRRRSNHVLGVPR